MARFMTLDAPIEQLGRVFGVADAELAAMLSIQPRTLDRWRADEAFPQHESRRRLEALLELSERLDDAFAGSDGASTWLHAESGYFGGLRPIDALLRGRADLVTAALEAIESGIYV